ncbi:hypothetical protein BJY24_002626 [Nocardia transvalensis]|uniref:Uncharacterized protein n=1 Tax=Nocardia transvalensis TaxID=37333 RepID=A0A7W9UHU9_9NOCA|nr:hypothetical protein [Nocardia transvalensis]MBB5913759.1 hypothetical protein [Nocardia transvalensis]
MQLGSSGKSGRLRNRLIVAVLVGFAGSAAWVAARRRPQLPDPAVEPPRLGYSTNGSTPQHAARLP